MKIGLEYSCLIKEYGIKIYKNNSNKLTIKFSKKVPHEYKINYLKIKTEDSNIFGVKHGEATKRVRRSISLRNFNQRY